MKQIKNITALIMGSCCLLVAVASAPAEDLYRAYERILQEAIVEKEQFNDRVKTLCRQIKADCEKTALQQGAVYLNSPVPLYQRNGYRIDKTGTLPPETLFILQGQLKGFYKIITADHKKYLLAINDFTTHYSSSCQAKYDHCLKGEE